MKQLKILLLACSALTFMSAHAVNEAAHQKIYERTAPVGQVSTGGDTQPVAAAASSNARSGEQVYAAACQACHSIGLLDAPKFADSAAWDERYAKGEDTLLKNSINGINAMPPRGTCGNCSDDELLAAIKHMAGR